MVPIKGPPKKEKNTLPELGSYIERWPLFNRTSSISKKKKKKKGDLALNE